MVPFPSHNDQVVALKRIEGQVRGIQKMIEENRYCVDILTQLNSIVGAIQKVQDQILDRHLKSCVLTSLTGKSESEKQKKIDEILFILKNFKKNG